LRSIVIGNAGEGDPAHVIIEAAEELDAELIVRDD